MSVAEETDYKIKKMSCKVANLQMLYDTKGPTSKEFTKELMPLIIYTISKKVRQFPEELKNHCYIRVMDRIKPKLDQDGVMRCFYVKNGKKKPGYNKDMNGFTNIGKYIMSVVGFGVFDFYYYENKSFNHLHNEELSTYDRACTFDNTTSIKTKHIECEDLYSNSTLRKLAEWIKHAIE